MRGDENLITDCPYSIQQPFSCIHQQILFHIIESMGSLWLFYEMTFTDKFILQELQRKGLLPAFSWGPSGRMSSRAEAVGTSESLPHTPALAGLWHIPSAHSLSCVFFLTYRSRCPRKHREALNRMTKKKLASALEELQRGDDEQEREHL